MMFGDTRGYFGSLYTEGLYSSPQEVQRAQTQSAQNQARSREVERLKGQLERGRLVTMGSPEAAYIVAKNLENTGTTAEEKLQDQTEAYDQLLALGEIDPSSEDQYNPYDQIRQVNEAAASFRANPPQTATSASRTSGSPTFNQGTWNSSQVRQSSAGGSGAALKTHGMRTPGALTPTVGGPERGTQPSGLLNLQGAGGNLPGGIGMQDELQGFGGGRRTPGGFGSRRTRTR